MPAMMTWDKQIGEPDKWYDRFHRYLMLGPRRSVLSVYNTERREALDRQPRPVPFVKAESVPTSWATASQRWDWRKRAELYDADQRRVSQEAIEKRRQEWLDKELAVSDKLIEQAERMLAIPLVNQVVSNDGKTVTIKPARWSKATAIRFMQVATELARRALDMEPEKRKGGEENASSRSATPFDMFTAMKQSTGLSPDVINPKPVPLAQKTNDSNADPKPDAKPRNGG